MCAGVYEHAPSCALEEVKARLRGRRESWDPAPLDTLNLQTEVGACTVSTVKLACPHPFGDEADARFETMIFQADSPAPGATEWKNMQWRYHTIQQARAGHEAAVYHLTNHLPLGDTTDFWRISDHIPSHLKLERRYPEGARE